MRIGTKFSLLVAGLLAITLGLTSVHIILDQREAARMQLRENAGAKGRLLSLIAPDAIIGYDFLRLNEYIRQIVSEEDVVFAAVFKLDGAPITSHLDASDPLIGSILKDRPALGVHGMRNELQSRADVFVESIPIAADDRLLGELVVATDPRRIDLELASLVTRQALAYLIIVGLLGVSILAIFRLHVARPVEALMHGAMRVRNGDYGQLVEVLRRDELGMLTESFNAMMKQVRHEREQLYVQANSDALTRLPNRKMALERIGHEIERARQESLMFAVLFLDLDNFKYINDTMGHAVGDKLLVEMARRFRQQIRAVDLLARLGGDEYLVLMPNIDSAETVQGVAENLVRASNQPARIEDYDVHTRCSVGVAVFPSDAQDAEGLMAAADSAMYSAKYSVGSSIQFYASSMRDAALRRVEFERDIYAALKNDEFFLVFQPVVRMRDYSYVGAEALVRWRHPRKGVLGPDEFIPVAEQTGQIHAIGKWVMEQACRSLSGSSGYGAVGGFIAINVSSAQLRRGFEREVEVALQRYGLRSDQLVLEITESALVGDNPEFARMFRRWRDQGIKVCLDDFGTGYSSLNYLSRFNFGAIKIDKSFVDRLPDDTETRAIVSAMIAIAKNLGIESVAEGVESEAQRQVLLELGCSHLQGYLHEGPMAMPEFLAYLGSRTELAKLADAK